MAKSKSEPGNRTPRLKIMQGFADQLPLNKGIDNPEFNNPNPVLRINSEGKILYANEAGRHLLKIWEADDGGLLPSSITEEILEAGTDKGMPLEIKCRNRFFSFNIVSGKGFIDIYGCDITSVTEREDTYRKIVERSGEGIIIADPDGKFLFLNQRFADLLGYGQKEILGRYGADFIYDVPEVIQTQKTRNQLKRGETVQQEIKFKRKDGRPLWTLYNASPLFDSQGKHTGNLAMHTDITERKKIEEELKRSEQLYRAIGESIDYGIWICDAEGRNIYASKSYLNLVGITQEECSEFGWGNTLHPDDAEKTIEAWKVCSKTGTKWDIEHRFKGADGKWHPILARGIPIRDDNGNILMWAGINLDISSIKDAQEELRRSEERYRNLVKFAPAVIFEMNLKGTKFLTVNDTMCNTLGHTSEELLAIRPLDLLDATGRMIFKERIKSKIHGENIINDAEIRILKKNGEFIHALINIGNITSSADNEPSVTVIAYDITERKQTEEALRESEKRFKELIKHAPSAIFEIDFEKMKFISVNDAFCTLTGYSWDEALSMDILNLLTAESKAVFLNRINKFSEGVRPDDGVEYQVVKKDGTIADTILNMAFKFNNDGKIVGAMVVGHDITQRKKIESNLREAQAKLNIALENGNIGIWELDLKTDVVIMDDRTERMFELKPGTFGKTYHDFEKLIHEEDLSHFQKASEKAITKGIPLDTIFRLKPKNDKTKYFKSKALVINDTEGNPSKFLGVCIDVTGLKEGTAHLELKLNEELLRSNKELERFAYVASHDLQEPLRMVSSFTQLLQQRYSDKLDQNAHEYIQFAVEGAKRMHEQINGLLEYSRVGTRGRSFTRVDMNQIVGRVQVVLERRLEQKKLKLTSDILPDVIADENQMIQLIQNLLSNAIKFSDPTKKIHIGYETDDGRHIFSVRDEGIGIDEQYFDRIFEMFQRLMPREKYEGTGIGLSICKRIVERHHGEIWIKSKLGEGSTFYFSLPQVI